MKTPNQYLVDRAMAKQEGQPNDGLRRYRESAQAQIKEPVIDALLFSRPSNDFVSTVAQKSGWIAQIGVHLVQKNRAGGFPQHFLLAVTETEVIALERRQTMKAQMAEGGEEIARWKRSELDVSTTVSTWQRQVTITPPTGPVVQCCVGEHGLSKTFVDLLLDPTANHQAVG
jgi:hypothetical protein